MIFLVCDCMLNVSEESKTKRQSSAVCFTVDCESGHGGSRNFHPLGQQSSHFGTSRSAIGQPLLGVIVTTKRVEGNDLKNKKNFFLQ